MVPALTWAAGSWVFTIALVLQSFSSQSFTLRFASDSTMADLSPALDSDLTLAAHLRASRLAALIARDPVAAVRAFHAHLLFQCLLGCTACPSNLACDGLAATGNLSILGPISAILGAVEPQMRGSLHIHMLCTCMEHEPHSNFWRGSSLVGRLCVNVFGLGSILFY